MVITSLKTTPRSSSCRRSGGPHSCVWSNYPDALDVLPLPALRHEHAAHRGAGRHRHDYQLGAGRLRLLPAALAGSRHRLLPRPGHVDDPDLGDAGAALHPVQRHRLGQHLPAADRAQLLRRPLLDLPAAPVLPAPAAGPGRRGAGRRRLALAHLRRRSSCRSRGRRWPWSRSSPSSTPGPTSSIP